MAGNGRETRLQVMLTLEELRAIDDWRFKQRMPTRAAAIRQLLNIGLRTAISGPADPEMRSQDFGLLTDEVADPAPVGPEQRSGRRKSL